MSDKPVAEKQGVIQWAAERFGVDAGKVMPILRATCFRVSANDPEATDAEVAALLIVARHYKLNPFTKEIFAFKDKHKGIVPIVSVDGWSHLVNDHDDYDGCDFEYGPEIEVPHGGKKAFAWIKCTMHSKNRKHPIPVTEYFDEIYQGPRSGFNGPWQTHPKRMERHKAFIQAARLAFGFSGIYDEDEAQRIIDAGGGVPVAPGLGDTIKTGEVMPTTRTDGLAADLAKRAAAAETIDPTTGEVIRETPESIEAKIDGATTGDQLAGILFQLGKLPSDATRTRLMQKWNGRVMALKEAEDKERAKVDTKEPPKAKIKGTKSLQKDVSEKMNSATTLEKLDEAADASNLYEWSPQQREELNEVYRAKHAALSG